MTHPTVAHDHYLALIAAIRDAECMAVVVRQLGENEMVYFRDAYTTLTRDENDE